MTEVTDVTEVTEMIKTTEVTEEAPQRFPLTLDEFCQRLSLSVRRPELIGGFHADAVRKGHLLDLEDAFLEAFETFRQRPA